MAKIRVQIPYKKFGVIEVSELEYSKENIEKAKKLIETLADYGNEEPSKFVKPNEKQLGLVKRLKGDTNKKFTSWDEFSAYIEELKSGEKKPSASSEQSTKEEEIPWDFDL